MCEQRLDYAFVECHGRALVLTFMHNNLLVNIRLSLKNSGWPCFHLCWSPINLLICKNGRADVKNGLQIFCRDEFRSKLSAAKNLIMIGLAFYIDNLTNSFIEEISESIPIWKLNNLTTLRTSVFLFGVQ